LPGAGRIEKLRGIVRSTDPNVPEMLASMVNPFLFLNVQVLLAVATIISTPFREGKKKPAWRTPERSTTPVYSSTGLPANRIALCLVRRLLVYVNCGS
jgi:hypothetical protein